MKYAIGIDIGGTNTRVALIDEKYQVLERIQFETDTKLPFETLRQIKSSIDKFDKEIVGIGLSCPGPLNLLNGTILNPPNLHEGWLNFSITKELSSLTGLPVYLENDANLAALAEAIIGQGKDMRFVQFLTVSTGLGAGFVVDKQIFHGAHGYANEVQNIIMWQNGPQHGKLSAGGIEAISSGTAIVNRAIKLGYKVTHAGEVNELALQGNVDALNIIEDAKEYLANTLAAIFAIVDPEIIILGGSVAIKIDGFVEDVAERTKKKVYPGMESFVKVVKSNLNEDSGLIGAACLAFTKNT